MALCNLTVSITIDATNERITVGASAKRNMTEQSINEWIAASHSRYENLTTVAASIIESLLRANGIDFLSVSGRTKAPESIIEKIKRKNYSDPKSQLTDFSGVRVILYFESQVDQASKIVADSFEVDASNSMNRDSLLSVDQIGYRSMHYVCDLGASRTTLPEYIHLANMKFEIQIRTVLQHAWAELAHDRNYKFSGRLPHHIERQLYLYAGMLEIADKGFDSLSSQIDKYINDVEKQSKAGDLNIDLNSVSLDQFVEAWARDNTIVLDKVSRSTELVEELKRYGIHNLQALKNIIPKDYASTFKKLNIRSNILGVIRDWMILNDYQRYAKKAWDREWSGIGVEDDKDRVLYELLVGDDKAFEIFRTFESRNRLDSNEADVS